MICFWAVYSKIIIFAPTNMEQERMIQLRIAGKTTQSKAYFGKALSNLLSVKVIMLNSRFLFIQRVNRRSSETSHFRPLNKLFAIQPIDVNESQASSPLDVVTLSAFAVKFHGDGDTRSQRFQFIRTFLSDSQALSVGLGKALDRSIPGDVRLDLRKIIDRTAHFRVERLKK